MPSPDLSLLLYVAKMLRGGVGRAKNCFTNSSPMPLMMMMELGVMVMMVIMVIMVMVVMMVIVVMVVMVEWEESNALIDTKENYLRNVSFVVTSIAACNENRLGSHDERQSNFLKNKSEKNDQHFGKIMNYNCN